MSDRWSAEPGREELLEQFSARLGFEFSDLERLDEAFRHRSWCGENGDVPSNERLEFLGDAVLQLAITRRLYATCPDCNEGVLAQRRAALVNTRALATVAGRIGVGPCLRLGRGEAATGGAEKESILADCLEAVFGAVERDGGFEVADRVILRVLAPDLERVERGEDASDPKSRLQEIAAHRLEVVPHYTVIGEGPDHAKEFAADVFLAEENYGAGTGRTKKEAEQRAAAHALQRLDDEGKLST